MSVQLLSLLKFFLVALLWLFFLRVARAVVAETRRIPAGGGNFTSSSRANQRDGNTVGPLQLLISEPKERAGETVPLQDEVTIGRAPGCAVALPQDSYTSNLHARAFVQDGTAWVEDLNSTNGTFVNGQRISAATPLHRGDKLQVGRTVMEVSH